MSQETEAGRLAAPGRKNQNLFLRTIGGWALLVDGFVMLLLVIGYTVTGGDAPIFPIAGQREAPCCCSACPPCGRCNRKLAVLVRQDCGAWASVQALLW